MVKVKKDYTVITTKKTMIVVSGAVKVKLTVTADHFEMTPPSADEYVFKSANDKKTLDRWQNVVDALGVAIQVLRGELKK